MPHPSFLIPDSALSEASRETSLVTIVALCHNHAPFLREALDSILAQTYPHLEVWLVDDASTDGSPAILREYAAQHPAWQLLLLTDNVGNCRAFNQAFRQSRGEYVIDFATDDVLLPARVAQQVAAFNAAGPEVGVVYSNAELIDEAGHFLALHHRPDGRGGLVPAPASGWVLAEVLRRRPAATVLYLEASPRMLARARARLRPGQLAQVDFRHGTQAALAAHESFDAVLTFFVLDCIAAPDLPDALARLHAALRPGGRWLLADFRPARQGWRRLLLAAMFGFFRLTTRLRARELPDLAAALAARGLHGELKGQFYGRATEAVVFQ